MTASITPVVLAGGHGTRLWPLSREHNPKQLLALVSGQTMLQDTISRAAQIEGAGDPVVLCNEHHRFMVADQIAELHRRAEIIVEPVGRNTAPAAAIAAIAMKHRGSTDLMLLLPADHVIGNIEAFAETAAAGARFAARGDLVTFGIVPAFAETGYGYIQRGADKDKGQAYEVKSFEEKPDQARADAFLKSGQYYWNSGMFLFRPDAYLAELARQAPDILRQCELAYEGRLEETDFTWLNKEAMVACPSNSIDYAVMEHAEARVVVPLDADWNDVGAWSALWDVATKEGECNVVMGDVHLEDVNNSYLRAESRMVVGLGLDDCIVVETADVVLVAKKDKVQNIKTIVNRLKQSGRPEVMTHRKVYRPWGSYEGIDLEDRFQVKRITVNPEASLSMQKHFHRAEHWIVVSGTAKVTRGDKVFVVSENESTYIPLGIKHRLENPGKIPLQLIEVQSGSYLGEDDIVRYDDLYGRRHQDLD